jgi:anti-sigma B factor antagonist
MEVTVTKSEGITTVVLEGRLDTPASPEVSAKLEPVVQDASGTIILDCGKLTYISSSGLRIFLSVRKAAAAAGGNVIVKSICPDIRNVFMMTGFLNLFQIED